MTKDEALRLALEALEDLARYEHPQTMIKIRKKDGGSIVTMYPHKVASDAITAIKAALEAKDEPVAWMFQHEETGRIMCVDAQQLEWGFEKSNPRLKKISPLYTTPPKLEAKDEPVAWVYPEFWRHLENLNCGTAYRLSGIGRQPLYTTPPQRKPLTDEEIVETFCKAPHQTQHVAWFAAGVRYAEAAHNIKE